MCLLKNKIDPEFGEFIKEKRLEKGLTQGEATRKAEIDQTQWSKIERGKRYLYSPKEILNISRVLEINPVEMLLKATGKCNLDED